MAKTGTFVPGRGIVQGFGNLVFALSDSSQQPVLTLFRGPTGTLSPLWNKGAVSGIGSPVGGTVARAAEQIGFFTGLGVVQVENQARI